MNLAVGQRVRVYRKFSDPKVGPSSSIFVGTVLSVSNDIYQVAVIDSFPPFALKCIHHTETRLAGLGEPLFPAVLEL
jgi:hypothetical protein